jgi:hypothetical protein
MFFTLIFLFRFEGGKFGVDEGSGTSAKEVGLELAGASNHA